MRWLREFETTAWPLAARAASASPATDESRPEKSSLERNGPSRRLTVRLGHGVGQARPGRRHVQASR